MQPRPTKRYSVSAPQLRLGGAGLLLGALLLTWWFELRQAPGVPLTPTLTGQVEYCLTCHPGLPEISPSHAVESFGCVICHGGERLALSADLAHSTLRGGANPSELAVAEASCGGEACHSGPSEKNRDHIARVTTSIQATYAGAIASIRYTFGAQPDLSARLGAAAVQDASLPSKTGLTALAAFDPSAESHPSVQQFGQNCLTCHLNAAPREGTAYARFGGCAACHTPEAPSTSLPAGEAGRVHRFTTAIPYTQCNTCHNRGNYNLRTMQFDPRGDHPANRIEDYYQPIAQFTRCEYTLDCIDCHTRAEAMGDGDIHNHMAEAQYVRCKTCHGTLDELPRSRKLLDANDLAFELARLNPVLALQVGDTILETERGEPLWNIRLLADGNYELIGKVTQQRFVFRPVMNSGCRQDPQQQESQSCHACHALEH